MELAEVSPTQVLIDQATTAVPSSIVLPVIGLVMAIVGYRIIIVGDRRPTTTAANWYGVWIGVYASTRIPIVQDLLMSIPGITLSEVRVIGSTADVAAALSLLLLALRWRSITGMTPRWVNRAAWVVAICACVALAVINAPAAAQGMAVEELGGWRFAAYATIYSGIFIPAEVLIIFTLIGMSRERASWPRKALVVFLLLAIGISMISLSTRILGSWLLSVGLETSLSSHRTAAENDVAFYASVLWLIPAAAPLVISDLRRRTGLDRMLDNEIARLQPMWEYLTHVAPAFRLAETQAKLPSKVEQVHRMRIEIEDITRAVSVRLDPSTVWPIWPEGRAALLKQACDLFSDGAPVRKGTPPPEWLTDEAAVDRTAQCWVQALDLEDASGRQRT